jgi:hypothetical protein
MQVIRRGVVGEFEREARLASGELPSHRGPTAPEGDYLTQAARDARWRV